MTKSHFVEFSRLFKEVLLKVFFIDNSFINPKNHQHLTSISDSHPIKGST